MVVADNKKYVLAFLIGMTGTALSLFSSPVEAFHEKAVQVDLLLRRHLSLLRQAGVAIERAHHSLDARGTLII